MKIDQHALETGLKMTSKNGIIAFTIIGVAIYLIILLWVSISAIEIMPTWKILFGSVGGAGFVTFLIIFILKLNRYFILRLADPNKGSR